MKYQKNENSKIIFFKEIYMAKEKKKTLLKLHYYHIVNKHLILYLDCYKLFNVLTYHDYYNRTSFPFITAFTETASHHNRITVVISFL